MTGVRHRLASAGDASIFAGLHSRCFKSPWDADAFERLLARPGALGLLAVDVRTHDAAGFALFEQVANEAEILTLGVRPGSRGRGMAAELLAYGLDTLVLRGAGVVHLEVAEDNAAALALYHAAGFTESGRRPGYYRRGAGEPPVDGLILSRRLTVPPSER